MSYTDEDLQKAAWRAIAKHWMSLYQICHKAAGYNSDLADELMSDCVYDKVPSIIENWMLGPKLSPLHHYLNSMIYWYVRKHLAHERKRVSKHECSLNMIENLDGVIDENLKRLEVHSLLDQLNERDRKMVELVKLEGYTLAECAVALDISIGHVSGRLKKIIRRLKLDNEDLWQD